MAKDPVCDTEVDEQRASSQGLLTQCEGRKFYFCSAGCKRQFERFPAIYGGIEPVALDTNWWLPGLHGNLRP